jgi:hypothetical protein
MSHVITMLRTDDPRETAVGDLSRVILCLVAPMFEHSTLVVGIEKVCSQFSPVQNAIRNFLLTINTRHITLLETIVSRSFVRHFEQRKILNKGFNSCYEKLVLLWSGT